MVVGIGSIDAHGVMKFGGRTYHLPTYAQVFRTLRTHVLLQEPLSYGEEGQWGSHGSGEPDLGLVHGALASGHSYIAYDNYADGTGFVFECVHGNERALMGDSLRAPCGEEQPPLRIVARVPKTRSFIRLYRDGKPVAVARGGALEYVTREPGAYRVEAFLFRRRIGNLCVGVQPWIFSNPIYVQPAPVPSSRSNAASISSGQTA